MTSVTSTLSSARFQRRMFWLGLVVLVAGIVFMITKLIGDSAGTPVAPDQGFKPQLPPKEVPLRAGGTKVTSYQQLDPRLKSAIRHFVLGAVAGENYADSWHYITKGMRGGFSHGQWLHANSHPIVPFPVYRFASSDFRLASATTKEVLVDVKLLPRPKAHMQATRFRIGLVPVGTGAHRHWLVDYWMPLWTPLVPLN